MFALKLLFGVALAGGPDQLGAGQRVVYTGVGASTFEYGSSGDLRDRPLQSRVDLYAAAGLHPRLELSVYAAPSHSRVIPMGRPPCAFEEGYCDSYTTVNKPWIEVRTPVVPGWAAAGLGTGWDPWNRDRRGQFNTLSQGTWVVSPALVVGHRHGALGWQTGVRWHAVMAPDVEGYGSPPDSLQAHLELPTSLGDWTVQPGAHLHWRVGGNPFGPDWAQAWYGTDDRWQMLRTRQVQAELKVSYGLGESGIHVAARRAVWTDSGPKDLTDVSVGWHRWFP